MTTRSLPAVELQHETNQHPPKPAKTSASRIPAPQTLRIMQRHVTGESARKIARDEGRDRATVAKIIKSTEMAEFVRQMRERFYGLGSLALEAVQFALQQRDAQVGYRILLDMGVIPSAEDRARLLNAAPAIDEAQRGKEMMGRLLEVALERQSVYGTPMSELDNDLKAARLKISAGSGQLESIDDGDPKKE